MSHLTSHYRFDACGLSDIGLVRPNNEDVWAEIEKLNFFALADGMGGHRAGEVASREAVSFLLEAVKKSFKSPTSIDEAVKKMEAAIKLANREVFKLSKSDPEWRGMGTTLSCIMLREDGCIVGNVGDSRIYRLRNNTLKLLTRDDSLFRELVDLGQLSEEHSPEFAYKNIITKAVGTEQKLEPYVQTFDLEADDLFLLTTDGITDLVLFKELEEILSSGLEIEALCLRIIEVSKQRGGYDNMTCLIIRCLAA